MLLAGCKDENIFCGDILRISYPFCLFDTEQMSLIDDTVN